jgi:P-loop Domain of unknown function (DUF2791)
MVNLDDLNAVLDSAVPATRAREEAWSQFGFLRNPFPSRSHPIWNVFYNQSDVKRRFLGDLREFLAESNTVTLFFTGGNRVGKTHFMEYHRQELTTKFREREIVVPVAVVSAQSCDFRSLFGQIIDQVDESLRIQAGSRLFEGEISAAVARGVSSLPAGDFRRAVETAIAAGDESTRLLLRRWLRGDRIRAPQRSAIGVAGLVESQSQMLMVLEGLVRFLLLPESIDLESGSSGSAQCLGVLLFLDEFELVWRARRDRRDQFLQAIRALIDACPKGLFLCVGMATGLNVEMEEVEASYPALFARLKGTREIPALVQVGYVTEAIGYSREFEKHARREFQAQPTSVKREAVELFSDQDIESFFRELAGRDGSVSQGDFFDRLHSEAERRALRSDVIE